MFRGCHLWQGVSNLPVEKVTKNKCHALFNKKIAFFVKKHLGCALLKRVFKIVLGKNSYSKKFPRDVQ